MKPLPSLRGDLLRHKLDGELLVYDPKDEQVHLLDGSTTKVVEMMDSGASADSISRELAAGGSPEGGHEMLALALDELASARLIEDAGKIPVPIVFEGATRRQMVQRLLAGSATLLIPSILTLTPSSAQAQSTGRANGVACTTSAQCLNGCCSTNSSGQCTQGLCGPPNCPSPGCAP